MKDDYKTVEILEDARRLLVQEGWCQNIATDDQGRRCLVSAISDATFRRYPILSTFKAFMAAVDVLKPLTERGVVTVWNDAPERTFGEVLDLLDTAISRRSGTKESRQGLTDDGMIIGRTQSKEVIYDQERADRTRSGGRC